MIHVVGIVLTLLMTSNLVSMVYHLLRDDGQEFLDPEDVDQLRQPVAEQSFSFLTSTEVRIVDENDEPVATGEVGELIVRSPEPWALNAGYYGMPEATALVMPPISSTSSISFHASSARSAVSFST